MVKNNSDTVIFDPEGCETYPNIASVEVFLGGVGRLIFPDGTVQFAENESYPDVVYSPRMTENELDIFCSENLDKYQEYNDTYFDEIGRGDELPPIVRFW